VRHDLKRPGRLHWLEKRESPGRRDWCLRDEEEKASETDHGVLSLQAVLSTGVDFHGLDSLDGAVYRDPRG
jgi:hypothetical protein